MDLSVTPNTASIRAGQSASYNVTLNRGNFTGPVKLAVAAGLPAGASAVFSPNTAAGNSSVLTVNTVAEGTLAGSGGASGALVTSTTVNKIVGDARGAEHRGRPERELFDGICSCRAFLLVTPSSHEEQ